MVIKGLINLTIEYIGMLNMLDKKKRSKRIGNLSIIPNRLLIKKRPKNIEKRIRPGDIEVDFMIVKKHKGEILVSTDRVTLNISLHKLRNWISETESKAIIKKLEQADYPIYTVTFENDLGFANNTAFAEA